ncbi:hypothetical protein B0H14DRAFT_3126072 [Mycena olivaceomarginata]|nr:hypothetical protein B0H14DRAFT_3126072 [Mycena olivaceomarginata]
MTVSTSFRTQNGATSHVSDDSHPHGASPSVQAQSTSSSSSFIFYTPSFAFHAACYVHKPARRASHRSHGRFTSPRHFAPRAGVRLIYFVIYVPSFASHGHFFVVPRRFTRTTSAHRTVLRAVTRIVPAVAHASHVTLQLTFDFGPSQKALAALLRHLATFDATFHLVSFDGSPLPMTRHPGGVAAHLLSPRRLLPRTIRISPRSASKSPGGSHLNPPHVPHAPRDPHAMPAPMPCRVPSAAPIANLNPPHVPRVPGTPVAHLPPSAAPIASLNRPHTPHSPVETPRSISSPDRGTSISNPPHVPAADAIRSCIIGPSFDSNPPHASHPSAVLLPLISGLDRSIESNLLHFPPVERLPSPPVYLPVPHPDLNPSADLPHDDSSPHVTLSIFEILFISPSVRTGLRELIDALDRGKVGYEWPSTPELRKVFYRILDRIVDSLSSPP